MTQKIILDVDTGIDDALAIAYAAASPEIELLGVTVTYGNTPLHNAVRNTYELLRRLNREVPVYAGASAPLERVKIYTPKFHGADGLGDTLGVVQEALPPADESAADFIIRQAYRYGKELTIVTTGPITNLALAVRQDPSIADRVGQVVLMGGAVMSPGNVTKFAEANVFMDPEAANLVFQSGLPVIMVGLDVTRKTLLAYEDMERWRSKGTALGQFFASFTEFYLNAYKQNYPFLKGCALHDPLAVAVAKRQDWVRTVPLHIHVDVEDDSRGRTTEDLNRMYAGAPATQVCVGVDAEAFMQDFYGRLEQIIEAGD